MEPSRRFVRTWAVTSTLAIACAAACGDDENKGNADDPDGSAAAGGSVGTGGRAGTGGRTSSGGATSTGGRTSSGGASATGGVSAAGGAAGAPGAGGTPDGGTGGSDSGAGGAPEGGTGGGAPGTGGAGTGGAADGGGSGGAADGGLTGGAPGAGGSGTGGAPDAAGTGGTGTGGAPAVCTGNATLTSACAGTHSNQGYYFDLEATNAVDVTGLELVSQGCGVRDVSIYYRAGTYVGSEGNASAWTLVGSTTNFDPACAGSCPITPTLIPIGSCVTIPAGQTYGFYVVMTAGSGTFDGNTNAAEGATAAQDANLRLVVGKAQSVTTPFYQGILTSGVAVQGVVHYRQ